MKKIVLGFSLLLAASTSFGACYNFINGRGPDHIGNNRFASIATQLCVKNVNGFSHNYISLEFSDSQGALAIVAANSSGNGVMQLTSGNINGQNANVTGTEVAINVGRADSLNAIMGSISIKAGRDFPQVYNMIKVQKP